MTIIRYLITYVLYLFWLNVEKSCHFILWITGGRRNRHGRM